MASTTSSTLTPQLLVDYARTFPWTKPVLGVAGYSSQPAVSFTDEVVKKILAKTNPWKWNAAPFPAIETQPYQQDYPTSISQNVMGWLQSAMIVDINNFSPPLTQLPITAVDRLLPTMVSGRPQKVAWIINSNAQTAVWGRGYQTDPGPNVVYMNPLVLQGGGPGTNPFTAITDSNGNILVVTSYGPGNVSGATGNTPPTAAPNAPAGTNVQDGQVTWTVQDPNGVALRVDALATSQSLVWELRVLFQKKPPNITALNQPIAPIPDDLNYLCKQGFLAYCRSQSLNPELFPSAYAQWMEDIQIAMGASDREQSEFGFFPSNPIQGGGGDAGGNSGTWGYPGWPGWS
jgi:hypothetical protein